MTDLNGRNWTSADFANGAHRTNFPEEIFDDMLAEIAIQIATVGSSLQATSSSSVTVGTGSKTFTVGTGKGFSTGTFLVAFRTSDPTIYMIGQVTDYSAGDVTISVPSGETAGSGTYTDWTIGISGRRGASGDVTGPGSSTDNALARWDGAGGGAIQDSGWMLSDAGFLTGTGDMRIAKTSADAAFRASASAGQSRYLRFETATVARWDLGASAAAEGGSEAGSDFYLNRFDDNGDFLAVECVIARADGAWTHYDHVHKRMKLQDTAETAQALGTLGAGTTTINLTAGNVATAAGQAVSATIAISNWPTGSATLTIDATDFGAFSSLTWPAAVQWPGGTAPTLTASGKDKIVLHSTDGGTTIDGNFQLDYS